MGDKSQQIITLVCLQEGCTTKMTTKQQQHKRSYSFVLDFCILTLFTFARFVVVVCAGRIRPRKEPRCQNSRPQFENGVERRLRCV
jgi:hypothetical protein